MTITQDLPKLSKKVAMLRPADLSDTESFTAVMSMVMEIINTQPDVLVIDMTRIQHIDSRGLGLLINSQKLIRTINGRLILCSLSEPVKLHLQLSGADRFLEIYNQYPAD